MTKDRKVPSLVCSEAWDQVPQSQSPQWAPHVHSLAWSGLALSSLGLELTNGSHAPCSPGWLSSHSGSCSLCAALDRDCRLQGLWQEGGSQGLSLKAITILASPAQLATAQMLHMSCTSGLVLHTSDKGELAQAHSSFMREPGPSDLSRDGSPPASQGPGHGADGLQCRLDVAGSLPCHCVGSTVGTDAPARGRGVRDRRCCWVWVGVRVHCTHLVHFPPAQAALKLLILS